MTMPTDPDNDGDDDTNDTDDHPSSFGYGYYFQPRPLYSVGDHKHKIGNAKVKGKSKITRSGKTGDIGRKNGGIKKR